MRLTLRPWQRHSLVLAVAGVVYIAYGATLLAMPNNPQRMASLTWALTLAPIRVWAAAFLLAGTLALASTRWPPRSKTWGYTALSGVASVWGSAYLVGVLFLDAPTSGLSGALVWGLVAFLWWAIAGLINPDDAALYAALTTPPEDPAPTSEG